MEGLGAKGTSDQELRELATEIHHDLAALSETDKLLLPGGWYNSDGGHAIIYQFTRHADGYHFTLFNAGDGLHYHAKKSGTEKELYNPTKTWSISFPQTPAEEHELILFVERLFKARLPYTAKYQKKPVDNKVLYQEILPSISYVGGTEIESAPIPEHGYTGGQLSGTCAQRAIHQMLKINSRSAKEYQRFIFKFKQYALFDYSNACVTDQQPFNAAVAEQIRIAIENNFKILNSSELFSESDIADHRRQLEALQKKLELTAFKPNPQVKKTTETLPSLNLNAYSLQAPSINRDHHHSYDAMPLKPLPLNNGTDLLANLEKIIAHIKNSSDPAARFFSLQQLLLELPINPSLPSQSGFYAELRSMGDFSRFQKQLNEIQTLLLDLEASWLNEEQMPVMNVMLQCLMSLHIDVYSVVPEGSQLPPFTPFSSAIMSSLLTNQERSAFNASNHPGFDKKLVELQQRFHNATIQTLDDYYSYYNQILETEPQLKPELKTLYQNKFSTNTAELHYEIRNHGLEALFMLAQDYNYLETLPAKFHPLTSKLKAHLKHEDRLRELINPFYVNKYSSQFAVAISHNSFRINSGLFPTFMPYELLLKNLPSFKYTMKDSPAKRALEADLSDKSRFKEAIAHKTANRIQLHPTRELDSEGPQQVTQEDIIERDYFHLRSEPKLQIALTLDYFNRNIERCADESNQHYIEANLFQPGLLLSALANPEFLPQFDRFLQTGLRYFTENGQHTKNSLFYLRLNYLVSRYLSLNGDALGSSRLKTVQSDIEKQLSLTNTPEVTYVLNQYLLLTLIERLNKEEDSEELFHLAYQAYVYLQGHTNPQIFEDKTHHIEVETALARFKMFINNQSPLIINTAIKKALQKFSDTAGEEFTITGSSPVYTLTSTNSAKEYEFNSVTGKLYEAGLAHHSVPLSIQHHSLIKHLGLSHTSECLINSDESYMVLSHEHHKVSLFYDKNNLIVQKEWTIAGLKSEYELQALTKEHQAYYANKDRDPIFSDLPKILSDGSMDFWRSKNSARTGILVRNNSPLYSIRDGAIWALDENGNETGYQLSASHDTAFNQFESNQFILAQQSNSDSQIHLPRYNLTFTVKDGSIVYPETGELVSDKPSPIHPSVAGLLLTHQEQSRYLVPIARFYATENDAL